ncbi:efflux RND transporter periplasmic adaptor subunit [Sphingobacterium siyangense]|uniref:RND family efflux transporter MFP subunit n=1 Tax=Sphingobacterium siyangense TaxID=459529 RepID=A0A562LZG9_9SPHI|nr:efflux RND transporter periplasmic adaptor subunit [Sphingobacterium siyangense]TWI13065.1 RND family efflux transporter MFP subunit [Sphingobacterium siyangense]
MKLIKLIATGGFILILSSCSQTNSKQELPHQGDIIPVKVLDLSSLESNNSISASGLIGTENETKYSFKIQGIINSIFVEEGQFFKKGELLAVLNATEISAGVSQNQLNVDKAERDYHRALSLYKDSVFTLEQLQNFKTILDVSKKSQESINFNAQYSKIYATSDGFVSQKLANVGEIVNPGTPILAINETSLNENYVLKVGVNDLEWAKIKIGQKASITIDGFGDNQFKAFVFRKSQISDLGQGSFQIELKLKLGDIKPAVGMFGKALIYTDATEYNIVIPYSSLVEIDGNKGFIFTPSGTNKVRKVPIVISHFDSKYVYLVVP